MAAQSAVEKFGIENVSKELKVQAEKNPFDD